MKTHPMIGFVLKKQILIHPDIDAEDFSPERARKFFREFQFERFETDGDVGSIVIQSGSERLPDASFALGLLFGESREEIEASEELPEPVGAIRFDVGGESPPRIQVTRMSDAESLMNAPIPTATAPADEPAPPPAGATSAESPYPAPEDASPEDPGAETERPVDTVSQRDGALPSHVERGMSLLLSKPVLVLIPVMALVLALLWASMQHKRTADEPLDLEPAVTALPTDIEPIESAWSYDIGFPWWQPLCVGGTPAWFDEGDIVTIEWTDSTPFVYGGRDSEESIEFGYAGVGPVGDAESTANLLSLDRSARVLGVQGKVAVSIPTPLTGDETVMDLSAAPVIEIHEAGYLYLCPNVPVDDLGNWPCSGTGELRIKVYAADGDLAPPQDTFSPALTVKIDRRSNIRSEPTTKSKILLRAQPGTRMTFLGKEGDWYQVGGFSKTDPITGWLHQSLVADRLVL